MSKVKVVFNRREQRNCVNRLSAQCKANGSFYLNHNEIKQKSGEPTLKSYGTCVESSLVLRMFVVVSDICALKFRRNGNTRYVDSENMQWAGNTDDYCASIHVKSSVTEDQYKLKMRNPHIKQHNS